MMDWQDKVNLKTLEIAFDQNCNLACSYCSPTCSTMWQNDIRKNGRIKI
jgi:molybdenum cofactor biosynthesis enzyme MoaA